MAVTWTTYPSTLPLWDRELLSSVAIIDRARLFPALHEHAVLHLASDGGAVDKRGSNGALLATEEHILVECGGRAQGSNPRSFCAKGYGILAVLRLVIHLRYYYVTRNAALRFRLYCDSESLLKRIAASQSLTRTIPRRFLFLEVDVEMQILAAVTAVGSDHVAYEHVEGHQDIKYPGLPLSWPATLNQRCDEIASLHLDSATSSIPSVTFLPASQVSISVGRTTLTHHIPTQLRTFAGMSGMRAHYCKHHEWDDPAFFDLVDWPRFHGATLSTTFLKRIFVIKWINFLLRFQDNKSHYFFLLGGAGGGGSFPDMFYLQLMGLRPFGLKHVFV
jgi:hypothetical protein